MPPFSYYWHITSFSCHDVNNRVLYPRQSLAWAWRKRWIWWSEWMVNAWLMPLGSKTWQKNGMSGMGKSGLRMIEKNTHKKKRIDIGMKLVYYKKNMSIAFDMFPFGRVYCNCILSKHIWFNPKIWLMLMLYFSYMEGLPHFSPMVPPWDTEGWAQAVSGWNDLGALGHFIDIHNYASKRHKWWWNMVNVGKTII